MDGPPPDVPAIVRFAQVGPGNVYGALPPIDDRGRDQIAMFRAWNPDPVANSARILAGVRPELAAVVRKAQADEPGIAFVVGSGRRSAAEQRQAAAWGWSPGGGGPGLRKHQDGEAVDLWPLDEAGRVTFAPSALVRVAGAVKRAARALGVPISWGGDWRSRRKDMPHFQLR